MSDAIQQPDINETTRAFAPLLSDLVKDPLFSKVWSRPELSPRDRSLITVAAIVVLHRPEVLGMHLELALKNGVTKQELSELVTHLAFYGGFPAALAAADLAFKVIGPLDEPAKSS